MLIRNAVVFAESAFHRDLRVRVSGGLVRETGPGLLPLPGEEVMDLEGDWLLPGFVDVHIHAFRGHDTMRGEADVRAMARDLRKEGVSVFCPTTMSASAADTARAVAGARQVRLRPDPDGARVAGVHMEAPFLSEKKAGAQLPVWFRDPSMELWEEMTGGRPEDVRLITLAPERPGSEAFIRQVTALGVHVSVGHTAAGAEQLHLAGDWGADHVTHTFNAQTPLNHREPGIPGAALADDRFYAEMICDGIHLHRDTVRLIWKAKGPEKAVVITDAMEAAGMPDGEYALGGQRVIVRDGAARLADGTLAGSVLRMPQALRNLILRFAIPPEDAVRMCAAAPADSIGEKLAGRILPGSPAPLTRWLPDWTFVSPIG